MVLRVISSPNRCAGELICSHEAKRCISCSTQLPSSYLGTSTTESDKSKYPKVPLVKKLFCVLAGLESVEVWQVKQGWSGIAFHV